MLLELRIENLLLIDRAELRPGPGLNAITGETGAGKTVLAHALDLLLGGKPRTGIVRPGASEAYVEGVFDLPDGLLELEEFTDLRERLAESEREVVLARRVSAEGRTRAYVQGRSATAADLRELGGRLLSFFGQHEHRKLTVGSAQLGLIDAFCGADHVAQRDRLAVEHARARRLDQALEDLRAREGTAARDLDLLRFEIEEIQALDPAEEDEQALLLERERLRRVDGLRAAAAVGGQALAPADAEATGAAAMLAEAERHADVAAGADPVLDGLAERLRALRLEAEDLGAELWRYLEDLEADPARLHEVEERLDGYDRLKRKHGGTVAAILDHAERCAGERDRLENAEVETGRVEAKLAQAREELAGLAATVSAGRREAAPRLAAAVEAELEGLAMEGASFTVALEDREQVAATGAERVEFMLASNPGVPAAPVRESASGGELSRVMLALMTVAGAGGSSTLVFDEVDSGVGGQTARAVGERLRALGFARQVLCITHLPQIAALADRHFRIEKSTSGEVARADVALLEEAGVVEELCRMLGADTSDAGARRHAEELLAAA
jgi:DNA repair protein RecN (Recombination protein N)